MNPRLLEREIAELERQLDAESHDREMALAEYRDRLADFRFDDEED